jgi:hypothetical protein
MKSIIALSMALLVIAAAGPGPGWAADRTKVDAATKQVERGAEKIGAGKIGEGVEETAKGIGDTVVEGSKFAGERIKESGEAAEPAARDAWTNLKEGATSFGQSVKNFFSSLFR